MDRLITQYTPCITLVEANYSTEAGQRLAHTYGIKSHPVVMVLATDNTVLARVNGVPDEATLSATLAPLCR